MSTETVTATTNAPAPAPVEAPAPAPAPAPAAAPAPAGTPTTSQTPAPAPTPVEAPASAKTEPTAPGAPEKYEFSKIEGVQLNEAVIGKFSEVAKSLNMPQDAAQKLLSEVAPVMAQQQMEAFKNVVNGWETQAKSDKEIGGDKLTENLGLAKKAMNTCFSPDFVKFLNESGLGNHPEMIRGLMKVGKLVSQDRFVTAGTGETPNHSIAERLYGSR